jgi:hypothetical protein
MSDLKGESGSLVTLTHTLVLAGTNAFGGMRSSHVSDFPVVIDASPVLFHILPAQ